MLLLHSGCKNCPTPVEPTNPCDTYTIQPLEIKIFERLGDTTHLLKNEFYGGSSSIVFAASKKCDTYQWQVGTDSRTWRDSSFQLYFSSYSGPIEVRLTTFTAQDTLCKPGDDGRDTVVARYTVINPDPRFDIPPITGVYRGVSTENLLDTFEVKLGKVGTGVAWEMMCINNLPKGCIDPPNPRVGGPQLGVNYGRRAILIYKNEGWTGGGCRNMYGNGWISEDTDTLTFRYNVQEIDDPKKRVNAIFKGVRIQ